VTLLFLAPSLG